MKQKKWLADMERARIRDHEIYDKGWIIGFMTASAFGVLIAIVILLIYWI